MRFMSISARLFLACAMSAAVLAGCVTNAETSVPQTTAAATVAATIDTATADTATADTAAIGTAPAADESAPDVHQIKIEPMLQDELESGCEIYAAVTLLGFYGYEADAQDFSQNYIPVRQNYSDGCGYYGPDLYSAFAGEPEFGYGAYAPVLTNAINDYLGDNDSDDRAETVYGLTLGGLCEKYISRGMPVMVWITTDMELPEEFISWTVDYADGNAKTEVGDEFSWPVNEHCMLLTGYDDENFCFADSLDAATVWYEREQCESVFAEMGSQAVVLLHPTED